LAQSENAIALRVAKDAGLERTVQLAKNMGIQSPLDSVPGLILGQSEVNLLELTGAYGTFADKGIWHRPHGIRRILDGSDCTDPQKPQTCREIYNFTEDKTASQRAIATATAQTMTAMLQGAIANGTGNRAAIGLGEAGKTGTTNNAVDLWFVGFIPSRHWVTGVWLGNDDNSPTQSSSAQAASLWGRYMGSVAKN
jgi:penicillin-binding protein 1A